MEKKIGVRGSIVLQNEKLLSRDAAGHSPDPYGVLLVGQLQGAVSESSGVRVVVDPNVESVGRAVGVVLDRYCDRFTAEPCGEVERGRRVDLLTIGHLCQGSAGKGHEAKR